MRKRHRLFLFLLAAVPLIGWGVADAQSPPKIKVGYIVGTPHSALFAGVEKGFFKAAGLDVELIPFVGGPPNLQALAAREIQFGSSASIPYLYYLTKRQDLVIVASQYMSGTARYLSGGWAKSDDVFASGFFTVLEDSKIRSVKDLKGKAIAAGNANGTWPEVYARKYLKDQGVDARQETTWTTLGFELMPGALGQRTVDAAFIWEPFYTLASHKYRTRVLFTDLDAERDVQPAMGSTPQGNGTLLFSHREFLDQNPAVVKSFLTAYRRAMNWVWQHFPEAKTLTVRYYKVPDELGAKVIINPGPRDGKPPLDALRRVHTMMLTTQTLSAPIQGWPERFVNFRFLDAVNAEVE